MQKYYLTTLRLWNLLKPFHFRFYLQLFYIICIQLINITTIYFASQIINKIVEQDFNQAYYYAGYVLAIGLTRYFIAYLQDSQHIIHIENGVEAFLQNHSLKIILKLNPSQYIEDHSAVKLLVINRGEEAVKMIVSIILFEILPTLTLVIFATLAIGYYSPMIALTTVSVFIIATIWSFLFARYHQKFIKVNTDNWDEFNKNRSETFQHLQLIRLFGVENSYLNRYTTHRNDTAAYDIFTWQKNNLNGKLRVSFFQFGKAVINVQLVYYVAMGKILVGDVFAIWSWSSQAFDNIMNIVRATRNLPRHFVELEKYLNIIDKKPDFIEAGKKQFNNGDIIFENVTFKYPKSEKPVIENLNLTIPKQKKVAFVGFSGSGKSTIVKLLLRIYDWNSGDIKLAGSSLRKIDAQTLRQRIGYVEQHVDLFDASVKHNILFSNLNKKVGKKIDEKDLSEVVHKSRVDQFFNRLGEKGLDTVIGERGVKLSGGERQRIGIARALIKNPEILIFDEATASLDTENEKYIQEAIDESSKGRTTIIIAHRLSTIQNSDIIFVMDKGKIVGSGSHDELKEKCSEYQRLIHAQQQ